MQQILIRLALPLAFAMATVQLDAQSRIIAEFARGSGGGPSATVAMGGKLYFSAYDHVHGRELWVTDGTSEGTYMVKDIQPGIGSGLSDIFELVSIGVGNTLYFRADDGVSGNELWRSDGTETGTQLVKDIQNGTYGSNPGSFAAVDGMLFFTAFSGSELWRSNGSTNGTQLVRTFSVATQLFGHQGTLYFSGDVDNTGQELWKSNGTFNTTERVRDLNGVIGASLPINFHAAGDWLYFDANTDTGWELWRTNGTFEGTTLVKDINPGGANGTLNAYSTVAKTNLGDTLYFRAFDGVNGYQLWRTTGTDTSTVQVSALADGVDASCLFPLVDGRVLMNNYTSERWWAYDPALDTTVQTGYPSSYYFNWAGKHAFMGNTLYYAGKDTAYGCELWRADGEAGDEHRTQETHFTDNWTAADQQPFTILRGTVNGKVLFIQEASANNLYYPLYSFDPAGEACRPPFTAIAVPVAGNGLHVVMDRLTDYGTKEVRYRAEGSTQWESVTTTTGYAELDVDAGQPWEFSVQVDCEGLWSEWSPLFTHDPLEVPPGVYVDGSILADRHENATTVRIYWTRNGSNRGMQMRYRPYLDPGQPWTFASDTTGMRRLTGLSPLTLYTYEYRFNDGTVWSPWSYSPLYFTTQTPEITTSTGASVSATFTVKPNPAVDRIELMGMSGDGGAAMLLDPVGRAVWQGSVANGPLDIGHLAPGTYLLVVQQGGANRYARFVKQ